MIKLRKFYSLFILVSLMALTLNSAKAQQEKYETAILAGGCFWGVQQLVDKLYGVVASEVGYSGGDIENPTYKLISTGLTNHAEAVEVIFDPQKISYEELLKFFFTIHDPTTLDRQGNDRGSQYRSEIFYFNDEQRKIALEVIKKADESGVFKRPLVTKVSKAKKFYPAEEFHQNYLRKNPFGYTCHHVREEWKF